MLLHHVEISKPI